MIKYKDLKVSDYEISLEKLIGKKIKDIRGYISEIGNEPIFKMTKIEFEDRSFMGCEGEHDYPYLVTYGDCQPNYDDDTLERLIEDQAQDEDF